jgi:hypothetical protein
VLLPGLVTFTVPYTAPDVLYYANDLEFNLRGTLNIVDPDPGTGPDFWIQAAPGVNGRYYRGVLNISSRPVLGVTNNGTDLGTINFDVPAANAQEFYYSMPNLGTVNLLAGPDILFNQLNGVSVAQFKAQFPTGIDGITEINNRTIVFTTPVTDPVSGGWQQQNLVSSFDPLVRTTGTVTSQQVSYDVNGEPYDDVPYETISTQVTGTFAPQDGELGSYDSLPFDQTTNITVQAEQYQIWQIQYVNSDSGVPFIQLDSV